MQPLKRDFDSLQARYDDLEASVNRVLAQKEDLETMVIRLRLENETLKRRKQAPRGREPKAGGAQLSRSKSAKRSARKPDPRRVHALQMFLSPNGLAIMIKSPMASFVFDHIF